MDVTVTEDQAMEVDKAVFKAPSPSYALRSSNGTDGVPLFPGLTKVPRSPSISPARSITPAPEEWNTLHATSHYNVEGWGNNYFSIGTDGSQKGHIVVHPHGKGGPVFDILGVVEEIKKRGLALPCMVRFMDVLAARVVELNETFARAIKNHGYAGHYRGVYPVKVNQMREVVEEIVDAGKPYHYGLEAGSKGELLIVLGYNTDTEALTCCNGYKDEEFLRLALLGRKLGRKVIVIIEKLSELPHLLRLGEEMGVEPYLGLRCKLTTRGTGKWESSGGDFAKFGLTMPEVIQAVQILKAAGKEHCCKLVHFHVGSQLTEIRVVKEAVREGARIYAKLRKMGLGIEFLDTGGGLGVDYVGVKSPTFTSSLNYSMDEYASDIVIQIQQICKEEGVPEPNITTESGRAITAHHACVIINCFGHIEIGTQEEMLRASQVKDDEHLVVKQMREILANVDKARNKAFHDAIAKKEEALQMFKLGILSLEDRATVESLYWTVCRRIVEYVRQNKKRAKKDTRELVDKIADQYLANFSLFQSAPDNWGIDQTFPIVPLHRLDEYPERDSIIVDITCDSDGKINSFVEELGTDPTISLHTLKPNDEYLLGLFLTGAYQDTMGNLHNLFGRVNEVHIFTDEADEDKYYVDQVMAGDSIENVLGRMQYRADDLIRRTKEALVAKTKEGALRPKDSLSLVDLYERCIRGYTYLRGMNP